MRVEDHEGVTETRQGHRVHGAEFQRLGMHRQVGRPLSILGWKRLGRGRRDGPGQCLGLAASSSRHGSTLLSSGCLERGASAPCSP